eukprot:evm.model.NODE_27573_length_56350_cov_23.676434.13
MDIPPMGHVLGLRLPLPSSSSATNHKDTHPPSGDIELDLSLLVDREKESDLLHPKELQLALEMSNIEARLAFVGGRLALRRNLGSLPRPASIEQAVLREEGGAPSLPPHVQASISHKKDLAVCLLRGVSEEEEGEKIASSHIGVDVEVCEPRTKTSSIATRVLTLKERDGLGALESVGISAESEILLRFSFKESVYKAIHPFVRRYVAFHEAEVTPRMDGTCAIVLLLKDGEEKEGGFEVKGEWRRVEGGRFFLTAVAVTKVREGKVGSLVHSKF